MIGAVTGFGSPDEGAAAGRNMAASLGVFAGHPAACEQTEGSSWCELAAPRTSRPGTVPAGWQGRTAQRGPDGLPVLFDGMIDNAAELAATLRMELATPDPLLYAQAVARWGDAADARIVGNYAAIGSLPGGGLRLSRAPWDAPSLFWARHGQRLYACSIPRPIFAAGFSKRLKPDQLAEALFWLENPDGGYWYEGLHAVPQGAVVQLLPDGKVTIRQWYEPQALVPVRLRSDEEYVEAANLLLADAVEAALRPAQKPAILLSGGLDSALVTAEMLAQTAPGELRSYTFTPLPGHPAPAGGAQYADERPLVTAFATMHPRLRPSFCDNEGGGFDLLAQQLFLASGTGRPSLAITAPYHGPALMAARDGCDWLFDASFGNATLSHDGRWAFVEFARRGRWRELWRLARAQPGDGRPMWRRLAARSLLPQLPAPLRHMVRALVHGREVPSNAAMSLLQPEVRGALGLDRLAERLGQLRRREWCFDRREWLARTWAMQDMGAELHHATSQVYGLRRRDVTAYRPLIEFCLGLPTEQFVRGGEQRWLARRMAAGRLPAAQAANRAYGLHHADWHARLSPRIPELRAEMARIADTPDLARIIDTDAALRLLAEWPTAPPTGEDAMLRHFHALAGAVLVAGFWRFHSGANG